MVADTTQTVPQALAQALSVAGMSQRQAAAAAGLSQATLSRIVTGSRTATVPELLALSQALSVPLTMLSGVSPLAERCQVAARREGDAAMDSMRGTLLHFHELDAYLDGQAVPRGH
ncbi:helix-turn-helix domain-containing protein [Actinomyces slackii]|uniref:Helix-turn-helix n=1 Tax=Actinomyces slackii TaxID=52774 RepID=A0A3S4WL44_9ACTO|nr:helix-turn-helix transcriptional regulator [Actinomyces slackii]VEG75271.1 Helix-turn-helix [Actinomyces slackii]